MRSIIASTRRMLERAGREPGARLPGLSQADSSARTVAATFVNSRALVRDLAGTILAKEHFFRNGSCELYAYRCGAYRRDGEILIRRGAKYLLLGYECSEMWSRALTREILECITLDVPQLPERPSRELIIVENGFLNIRTRQLFPHSPHLLPTDSYPCNI